MNQEKTPGLRSAMRIIVGISGASGAILGINLLKALAQHADCETHLVVTAGAQATLPYETDMRLDEIARLATHYHAIDDMAAPISSGSFITAGMVIVPCSMKTLAGVVTGYSDNLLLRAADVCLKERRRVVLVPREMPLSSLHLGNMLEASRHGCVVMPPVMTFYNKPQTVQDVVDNLIGRILMSFGLSFPGLSPWK